MPRSFPLYETIRSFLYPTEDDEKEKLCPELGRTHGEAGGLQKMVRAAAPAAARRSAASRSASSRGWVFGSGFRGRVKANTSVGYVVADLRQERCPWTSCGGVAGSIEVTSKKPFRQELDRRQSLGIQTHLSVASACSKCCVDVNVGDELPSFGCGVAWLLVRMSVYIGNRLICCMFSHLSSVSGDDIDPDETEPDHHKPDEVHLQRSTIQLNMIISDDMSALGGGQVRADSTFVPTAALHDIDQNSIVNAHVETAPTADITIESEVDVEEQVLRGLSRFEYEHIVFQVCPSLPPD